MAGIGSTKGTTNDLVRVMEEHFHNYGYCYPHTKAPIQLVASGTAWTANAGKVTLTNNTTAVDNAAAVNIGGGVVQIPSTGHHVKVGYYVTVTGSTNYKKEYPVVAVAANTVNITAPYVAENFAGTELLVDIIPEYFDIHYLNISDISANGSYEVILYKGNAGAEIEIARTSAVRNAVMSQEGSKPVITEILPARTRISADLLSSNAAANTCNVKLTLHRY